MSFFRKCTYCGETISFRQMRKGQWVAFDPATDHVHECYIDVDKSSKDKTDSVLLSERGIQPVVPDEHTLEYWLSLPRRPVPMDHLLSDDVGRKISSALGKKSRMEIVYSGGKTPMSRRTIEPLEVFDVEGLIYLDAYCHLREENRCFRLDRIIAGRIIDREVLAIDEEPNITTGNFGESAVMIPQLPKQTAHVSSLKRILFLLFVGGALFALVLSLYENKKPEIVQPKATLRAPPIEVMYVQKRSIRVRNGPGFDYEVATGRRLGDKVFVKGSNGDWYRIVEPKDFNKTIGWIHRSLLGNTPP